MTMEIRPLPDAPEPLPDAGLGALATERGNLPLESVDVRSRITGLVADVELTQGFRNPFDVPVEATYIFPLPDRAAVAGLRMEADDRVVEAVLEERAKARADYDQAVAHGKRAAIAEEDRPDVFTMRVGNILPGERVTVTLTLVQPLPYEDGAAGFRFPLVVAPRFVPGSPLGGLPAGDGVVPDTDAVPDASRISPPVLLPGFPNPVRLSLTVEVDPAGLRLGEVRSSLHVVTSQTGDQGRTTLSLRAGERLDRDFLLRLGYAPQDAPSLTLATDDAEPGAGTFTLTVLPPVPTDARPPRDVVIVLDRSGSMGGWKMVAARRAAARVVDTLTAGDRFAVLSFDNVVERPEGLPSGLADATDRNRFRAVEHLAALQARGGTMMVGPLREAVSLLADGSRDRVLVLVTDGQVGNEDHLLAELADRLHGTRIHTVGIDRAVNAGFLGRLAELGAGRFELVESEDRLDEAMENIHHRIGAPLVTDLSLDTEGDLQIVSGTVAPSRIGAVYPGVPLVVRGRWAGSADGALTVKGTAADGSPWSRRVEPVHVRDGAATRIWARSLLRELEDRYTVSGDADLEGRIVSTSLGHGVLCRFTAFVAVDSRVVAEGGKPHRIIQPVEMPSGWEMELETRSTKTVRAFSARERQAKRGMPAASPRMASPSTPAAPPPPSAAPRMPSFYDDDLDLDIPDFLKNDSGGGGVDPVAEARRKAETWLSDLTEGTYPTAEDRWAALRRLRGDLLVMARALPGEAKELRELAEELTRIGPLDFLDDIHELWDRAVKVLERIVGTGGQRDFWKPGPR